MESSPRDSKDKVFGDDDDLLTCPRSIDKKQNINFEGLRDICNIRVEDICSLTSLMKHTYIDISDAVIVVVVSHI